MRSRIASIALAVVCLALPAGAAAQSAGDEQYSDPLAGQPSSGGGGGGGSSGQTNPSSSGTQPSTSTSPPVQTAQNGTSGGQNRNDSGSGELPHTGLAAGVLAALGALFMLGGQGLRKVGAGERLPFSRRRRAVRFSRTPGERTHDSAYWNDLIDALGRRR